MKDILKVEIDNIQAVKHASIEIEGFTAVVGRSNSGKSSLIRGLHAALTNKSPKTIFRTGTKESRVKIEDPAKGISIEWKKGEKINAYKIDGKEFTKVGKEVPKEIEEHGFKDIRVNDESLEVQFARQHEYIFLLNRSGGFVADFISKITKADVLTGAVKDCESDIRKSLYDFRNKSKDKDSLDEQLQRFVGLDKLDSDLSETLSEIQRSVEIEAQVQLIQEACSDRDKANSLIKTLKGIVPIPAIAFDVLGLSEIESQLHLRDRLDSDIQVLSCTPQVPEVSFDFDALEKIKGWSTDRDSQKTRYVSLKSLDGVQVPQVDFNTEELALIDEVCHSQGSMIVSIPDVPKTEHLGSVVECVLDLSGFSSAYETIERELLAVQDEQTENRKKLQSYLEERSVLQSQLGGCPMCGKGFNGEQEEDCHIDGR